MIKTKFNVSLKDRILIYNTYVKPIITYGITVWGSTNKQYLDGVIKFQNKVIRNIKASNQPSSNYKTLKLMTLSQLKIYEYAKFMHKVCNNASPVQIKDVIDQSVSHRYHTRTSNMRLPTIKLTSSSRSINFTGPSEWNKIPPSIRDMPRSTFGKHLKAYILSWWFYVDYFHIVYFFVLSLSLYAVLFGLICLCYSFYSLMYHYFRYSFAPFPLFLFALTYCLTMIRKLFIYLLW